MVIKRPYPHVSVFVAGLTLLVAGFAGGGSLAASTHAAGQPRQSAQPPQNPAPQNPGGQRAGQPPRGPFAWEWWKDEDVKRELGLNEQKVTRIDNFYQSRTRQLSPVVDRYRKESDELERMTRERSVDDATYGLQVTVVESLRSKLGESRTMMLYRMYMELTQDQYKKLLEIRDRKFRRGGHPAQ